MAETLAADQGDIAIGTPSVGTYSTASYHSYARPPANADEFYAQSNSYAGASDSTTTIMMAFVVGGYAILGVSLFFAWYAGAAAPSCTRTRCFHPAISRLFFRFPLSFTFAAV